MIHPDTRLIRVDDTVGAGLVATRRIPRGTVTWVQDALDRAIPQAQIDALPAAYAPLVDRWTFSDGRGKRVLCWDFGRYLNHSCAPNCGGSEYGFELALRDIAAGEQLTNDYATLFLGPTEGFDCRCGAPNCRGAISHLQVPSAVQGVHDGLIAAFAQMDRVRQPLAVLLDPLRLAAVRESLGCPSPLRRARTRNTRRAESA
ncbi:SET domain-containing protein [Aquimonas sp.]|jgi:hypothetical protein|uniref:SET domain-containing protein n=1 Tax=Aquimonas sp. TaxID=1872588 RepID=UPI0037C0B4EA